MSFNRRGFLAAVLALCAPRLLAAEPPRLKIGVIGSGRLGGAVGTLWARAGHQVMFSGLDLAEVKHLAANVGANALAGTPQEAARFGEVALIAVPYSALPQVGRRLAPDLKGKIVLDASNPVVARDGEVAVAARAKGTGVASLEYLPGVRLVRAFNSVNFAILQREAHRAGERIGIPLAADYKAALDVAARLVREAGFEPVIVGGLHRAREFDVGTAVYGKGLTARELRAELRLR